MADPTTLAGLPPSQNTPRGARGSYSSLICLHCRGRKIKCLLPEEVEVVVSDAPQPLDKACQRCRNLGLECIVQPTILGRPAAKRRRDGHSASISSSTGHSPYAASSVGGAPPVRHGHDEEVKDYLVTDVHQESTPKDSQRPLPDTSEVFKTMVSPAHLASVLLANDRRFGVSIPSPMTEQPQSLTKLVSSGMTALLDENLRPQLVADSKAAENKATKLLFALLALLAIDAPSNRLREDQQLRHHLKTAVSFYGQAFLFDPPTHRHTIIVLMLLTEYHPAALIGHQSAACASITSHLYITLTYRIAERLGMQNAAYKLRDFLDGKTPEITEAEIDTLVMDALQWCRIVIDDAFVDGFMSHSSETQWRIHRELSQIVELVDAVAQIHPQTPLIFYHYWNVRGQCLHMHGVASMRASWKDLSKLYDIMQSVDRTTSQEKSNIFNQQPVVRTEEDHEIISAAKVLLDLHMDRVNVSVTGSAMFAAMMHGTAKGEMFGPKEAIQISEIAVNRLKDLQLGKTPDTAPFLVRYLVSRPDYLQRLMDDHIHVSGNLKLAEVRHLPPARQYALMLLFHCKVMVEDNAIRLKGWNMLHPGVDSQLKYFAECADKLESMAVTPCRSAETAFADGCLNAASAKFVRCLRVILTEWKAQVGASTSSDIMMHLFQPINAPTPSPSVAASHTPSMHAHPSHGSNGHHAATDDFEFDDLFGQWSNWPQAGILDSLLSKDSIRASMDGSPGGGSVGGTSDGRSI